MVITTVTFYCVILAISVPKPARKDKRSRDSHEDARRHEYGKDVDSRSPDHDRVDNEEFYDHYQVRMSDLQVLLLRDNHDV